MSTGSGCPHQRGESEAEALISQELPAGATQLRGERRAWLASALLSLQGSENAFRSARLGMAGRPACSWFTRAGAPEVRAPQWGARPLSAPRAWP